MFAQADAVNAYFASGVPLPDEDYYKEGRAYPDVAAFGQNVQVFDVCVIMITW